MELFLPIIAIVTICAGAYWTVKTGSDRTQAKQDLKDCNRELLRYKSKCSSMEFELWRKSAELRAYENRVNSFLSKQHEMKLQAMNASKALLRESMRIR